MKDKLIFKLWFKNGTHIEKEVAFSETTSQTEFEAFYKGLPDFNEVIEEGFMGKGNGSVSINNMIINVSELIAVDIIPVVAESEGD